MEGNRVSQHGEYIHDNLLEQIQRVDVDRIQASLRVGTAGKHECINIGELALAASVDGDRSNNGSSNDKEVLKECQQYSQGVSRRKPSHAKLLTYSAP